MLEWRAVVFLNKFRKLAQRTGGRVVEGARLESVYTFKAYRGFESPSVRQTNFLQSFNSSIPIGKLLI